MSGIVARIDSLTHAGFFRLAGLLYRFGDWPVLWVESELYPHIAVIHSETVKLNHCEYGVASCCVFPHLSAREHFSGFTNLQPFIEHSDFRRAAFSDWARAYFNHTWLLFCLVDGAEFSQSSPHERLATSALRNPQFRN